MLVGSTRLSRGGQYYEVDLIISHPQYVASVPIQNDVAVMRLSSSIEFSSEVNVIRLAESLPDDHSVVKLTGWGDISYPSMSTPDKLQTIDLFLVSNEYCSSKLHVKIPDSSLCTLNGLDEGACYGDR